MDLSLHPESDSIEKLLVSLIQRGVIKQQTKGEPLVQSPATFTNGTWDTPYLDLTELKEIQKYLGTNTLAFYLANGETRTEEMKIAIALQGDFRNLLNANDLEGNKIETIERLNQLIKNPEWFAKNKKSLTLFGPRIPNDAHNTIEAATVWHFLPEAFGNTIITPTEIVAKAGSDFDGDKLFMSMPNIGSDGNYIDKGVENFDKVLEETKELEKKKKLPKDRLTSRQLIELQKKYLQNRYLQASVEILMLPENAVTLTKPNGTYLVDRYEENVTEFRTGYDKFKNVGGRPSDVNTKGIKIPNTSNHFTAGYNLYVHDANLSLEPSLGILAKLTKSIPMYKAAGAKMPATYNAGLTLKVPLDVRFNKNTTVNSKGETVISIGAENNVAGENISDTTSHSLQGVLDRAKATFPFELKLVPEAMDVYGYLTRAGVDQEQIVYLLNQPLVSQYLDLQKINESSINNALFGKQKKFMISQNLFIENLKKTLTEDQLKRLVLEVNKNKLAAIMKSLPEDLELQVIIPGKGGVYTVAALRNQLNAFVKTGEGINPNSISSILINLPDETKKEIYSYVVPTFDKAGYLLSKENAYFLIDYIAKNTLANKDEIQTSDLVDIMKKQDSSSLKALMIFAHYVELERQYSRMNDLEKSFTPDTAKVSTTQEAIIRKKKYKTFFSAKQTNVPEYLKQSEEIDQDFLNKLMNESVVSSLIFDDLTIDLLKPLFQTKLDDGIVNYIDEALKENRGEISNAFGVGADGRAEFIRQYGNTLVNFIYQNYLSYSSDATGKLVNYPEAINGKEVVVDNTMDVLVKIEEDKILINTRIIEFDFANKSFLENNDTDAAYVNRNYDTFKVGQDPFKNLRSFYRYHIELALLEENNSIDSLADSDYFGQIIAKNDGNIDQAYIQYISERALSNSYNPYYIMGRTKYSYTNNVLELIDSLENYPALFDRFPILTQISPQRNREGFRIIRLNNRSDVKGALAQDYYNQIRQLGDISIQKLDNPSNNPVIASKDKRISEIFNLFSIMMYYQHGVGKSGTSFNSALDSSQFKDIIMPSTEAFMGNYINPSKAPSEEIQALLNAVYQQTVSRQRFKIMLGVKNEYANADIEAIANELDKKRASGIEEFELDEASQMVPSEFKQGEKLILDEDVKAFKRYLISSNGIKPSKFTTLQTKFPAFYNGRQQGMPNTAAWMLNKSNLYDMVEISQDSDLFGTVYYENVDLETGYQMFKGGEGTTQPTGGAAIVSVADVPQNKVSGVKSFGSTVVANNEAIKALGPNPHSIDMIESGFRTRTTRSESEMAKYAIKVGDIIKHFGKSADGSTKTIYAKVTAIHPKGSEGWKGTWNKEGWRAEDVNVIDRFKDGAAAIEFEVIEPTGTSKTPVFDSLPGKSTTPTMTYAGIGSRQTPQEALDLMPQIAKYLDDLGYTLRSGAAEGADTAFENGATKKEIFKGFDRTGQREINVANEIHPDLQGAMNASKSKKIKSRLAEGATQEEAEKSGERSAWAVQNLMARNTNQVFGANLDTPVDFVLFWAQEIPGSIRPKGGTGQAVEMARRKGIPTINLADKNWREQLKAVLSNKPSGQPQGPVREGEDETPIELQIKILEREIKELREMDEEAELVNKYVIIARNMKKITPESARKETGAKTGTNKDINIGLLDKNGVSVERAAESIWMDYFEEDGLSNIDVQDVRSIIIEILTMGKNNFLNQYLNTNQIAQKEMDLRELKEIQKGKGAGKDMSNTSLVTDMEEYARLVAASNGVQPKSFAVGTRTWTFNKFGNYDWSDPTTGQIYMRNINMETGVAVPEPKMNEPVDPALIEQSLNFIDSNRKLLALDHKFADMGYDINDIIKDLMEAKTMQDYFNVKEKLDKLC
jgi:hypothetical protein